MMQLIGILFIGGGAMVFVMGYKSYHNVMKKLEEQGFKGIPSFFMGVLTIMMLLGTVLGLTLVFLE